MTRLYIPAADEVAARRVANAIAHNLFGVPAHYQSEAACLRWMQGYPRPHRYRLFIVDACAFACLFFTGLAAVGVASLGG